MYRSSKSPIYKDLEKTKISKPGDDVALHQANFVKSKRYRVAKGCEIVGCPSLYIILCCAVLDGTNNTLCTDCTDSDVH